jgi:2-phospho-L-lactate/phosphoenolpyruvate guanylyltransferase
VPAYVVVLPVKPPARGKSRLRGLPDGGRHDLAVAFALDTATACLAALLVEAVLVVTDDAALAGRLDALGCATVPDAGDGLNGALLQAAAEVRRRWPGAQPVALLADLPALHPGDLDEALAAVGALEPAAAYVADAEGTGTTMYTAPADRFDPAFGVGSAAAHRDGGARPVTGELPTLRRDVDDVDDLRAAVDLGVGPATPAVVAGLALA